MKALTRIEAEALLESARDALAEANSALGWASSMLIEGVEFYTVREVLHAAQKDALKCYKALTRAESALRELECRRVTWDAVPGAEGYAVSVGDPEPRYTVEEVLGALDELLGALDELDPSDCVLAAEYLRDGGWVSPADFIKRRLADRGEKNG